MISNTALVQHLIDNNSLKSSNIIEAFNNVDRADFVLDPVAPDVYETTLFKSVMGRLSHNRLQ